MITGGFVSCYSCAGEPSDQIVDQLGRGDVQELSWRPSRASTRLGSAGLYSLIIFNYTAIKCKTLGWVGVVAGRGCDGLERSGGSL